MKEIRQELVRLGFKEIKGKWIWSDYTYLWESGDGRSGKHTICITSQSNCRFIFQIDYVASETGQESYGDIVFSGTFSDVSTLNVLLDATAVKSIISKGKNNLTT